MIMTTRDFEEWTEDSANWEVTDPLIGQTLDTRWHVAGLLGQGGMCRVYEASDQDGSRVAVKLLLPEYAANRNAAKRFRREANILMKLDHPNVVKVKLVGTHQSRDYMVLELLDGRTLKQTLAEDERFSFDRIASICSQIADGLSAAHSSGIIHRDLKPENIMLIGSGDSETVKVLDFGIAHRDDTYQDPTIQTSSDSILGTPQYMAPEQALGDPIDARADIYTLGLICYEMIAGQPAFKGGRREALICRQISENPPPLKEFRANVPALLEVTVRKAIEKKPRRRHQTAQELADDFRRALVAARMLAGPTSGSSADDSDTSALSLLSVGFNNRKTSQAQSFDKKPAAMPLVTEVKPNPDAHEESILVSMPATVPDNNLVRWIGPTLLVIGALVLLSILGYKVLEGIGVHLSR